MDNHVCPWWVGYFLLNPLRYLLQNPQKILSPYVKEGMRVLDVGCAMGFFSIPLAEIVGDSGKVICIDLQDKMLKVLKKRLKKAGLLARAELRICDKNLLGINDQKDKIDFVLAFAVVHEISAKEIFFTEIKNALKHGCNLMIAEPKGRVSKKAFEETVSLACKTGFVKAKQLKIYRSNAILLKKE